MDNMIRYGPNTVDKLYRSNAVDNMIRYGPNTVDKLYGPNTVDKLGLSRAINSCDLTKPLTLSFGLVSSELFPLQ